LPRSRIPILFTEHGRDYPDFRRWKRVLANRALLGRHDRFIAVGDSVRRALIDYEGLPAQRVRVIRNGSNLSAYDAACPQRAEVRRELGLTSEELVIIQVARLNRLKDHSTAIRAMARLHETIPQARLVVVGEGEERAEIERLIVELRLDHIVRLLGSRSDIPRLLQSADIFLLSSISEGIPLTLIEAMATGLPCVATRVGGVLEVVVPGETGLLANAGDAAGIAECLRILASDPLGRRQMGKSGSNRAIERFDASAMHAAYRQLYRELTSSNHRPMPVTRSDR